MENYLSVMETLLNEEEKTQLKGIYAPVCTAIPGTDARRGITVMPDGEIRVYQPVLPYQGEWEYLSSYDCGLSFKLKKAPAGALNSSVKIPGHNRYVTVTVNNGALVGRYAETPDAPCTENVIVPNNPYGDIFQPYPVTMPDGHIRLIVCVSHTNHVDEENFRDMLRWNAAFVISDDLGETWRVTEMPQVPHFEERWPHQGTRWENSGSENHIVMMPDGTLTVIARTSQDYFYYFTSDDYGDTWSEPFESPFHGTLTTPYFLGLSDGRVAVFWNNTQPLPESDHHKKPHPVGRDQVFGKWEDVFTNRDACHAAVTEDGKSFKGFREIWLNDVRNSADFRSVGTKDSADKSVHQFQAIELPYGKILLHLGQNGSSRRLVIFDVNWLLESERHEDFQFGLANVSTHLYVNGYGSTTHFACGYAGHCAYNRTNGALLVPEPEWYRGQKVSGREVLQIARVHDPRLVCEKQGVTWNFPASHKGEVNLRMRVMGAGVTLSLTDRWFNPCDDSTPWFAMFAANVDRNSAPVDEWFDYTVRWDGDRAEIFINGEFYRRIRSHNPTEHGISYLHLITLAESEDFAGTLVMEMDKK